jgi:hypothetical protein
MIKLCSAVTISLWVGCEVLAQAQFPLQVQGLDAQLSSSAAPARVPRQGPEGLPDSQAVVNAPHVDGVTPDGKMDGTNRIFVLPCEPWPAASLLLYLNGMLQRGPGTFTLSGSRVVFVGVAVPQPGDALLAFFSGPRCGAGGGAAPVRHRQDAGQASRPEMSATPGGLASSTQPVAPDSTPLLQELLQDAADGGGDDLSRKLPMTRSGVSRSNVTGETMAGIAQRLKNRRPASPLDQLRGVLTEDSNVSDRGLNIGSEKTEVPDHDNGSGSEALDELFHRTDKHVKKSAEPATLRKLQGLIDSSVRL